MESRFKKPEGANPYYIRKPEGISSCILGNNSRGQRDPILNTLPNCVAMALGRLSETNGRWIGIKGNAADFIKNCGAAGLTYQQEPTLGGILVWSGGNGGAGHVAFVERINSDGSVTTSESEWNGAVYATYRRSGKSWTDGCAWMRKGYTYLGCIKNPAVAKEMEDEDMIIDVKVKDAVTGEILTMKGIYKDGKNYVALSDLAAHQYALVGWDGQYPLLTKVKKCCCGSCD